MGNITRPWRHYADFSGRSRRTEYFLFFIVLYGALAMVMTIFFLVGDVRPGSDLSVFGGTALALMGLVFLASIIPSWAVTIRRLHDQDKSGWYALLTFIPYIGPLILLVLAFLPGTDGENDYGFDPRTNEAGYVDQLGDVFS